MSKKRFLFILKHLTFGYIETGQEIWEKDRFAAFLEFFENFGLQCQKMLVPKFYLAVDETFYSMRTRVLFKQFNPSKPAKFGKVSMQPVIPTLLSLLCSVGRWTVLHQRYQ